MYVYVKKVYIYTCKLHPVASQNVTMKYYLAPDSALQLAPYSKILNVSVLVPSLTTIDHSIIFKQNTLHCSFISKNKLYFSSHKFLET